MNARKRLEDSPIPTRIKLSLLWASLMSLYIYNDYFVLFVPGTIDGMAAGSMGPLGNYTDTKMIGVALILAIPASMVFLSSIVAPRTSRILNLTLGIVYAIIALLTLIGSPIFYKMVVCFQLVALALIIKLALRWT
ncbi:DUF6326 family protein [Pleionea mediterranea]|uniref:MFS transporter n=1 Tax=Pleionea mediterranea TaxID=523701 RepID=A0A316FRJ2_9GAMM|nr:DUF6326 family protein [Pleionea mediterranea]PWK50792.1 hypothetical protein C8D97_10679 [Pleionea mediterranea]